MTVAGLKASYDQALDASKYTHLGRSPRRSYCV